MVAEGLKQVQVRRLKIEMDRAKERELIFVLQLKKGDKLVDMNEVRK